MCAKWLIAYLGSNNELVANATLLRPLADEFLRTFVLAAWGSVARNFTERERVLVVRSVNEVSARIVERIEQLEAIFFVHCTHANVSPLVANAHGTEAYWRNVQPCERGELAMTAELGWRWRRGCEDRHDASEMRMC